MAPGLDPARQEWAALPDDPDAYICLHRFRKRIPTARRVRQQYVGFTCKPAIQRRLFDRPAPIGDLRFESNEATNSKGRTRRDHRPLAFAFLHNLGGEQTLQELFDAALKDRGQLVSGLGPKQQHEMRQANCFSG